MDQIISSPMPTSNDIRDCKLSFLPVGSVEQHGPHLPLNTDSIIAYAVAKKLSQIFQPSYLLPCLPYSSSYEHSGFTGTVSLRIKTVRAIIADIAESLSKHNISCVIVNFHFGNNFLHNVVQELNYDDYKVLLVPSQRDLSMAYKEAGLSKTPSQDMHAGEAETSLLMHLFPGSVKRDLLKNIDVPYRPLLNTVGFKGYSVTGTIGFPELATSNKGARLLESLCDVISKTVKEFISLG